MSRVSPTGNSNILYESFIAAMFCVMVDYHLLFIVIFYIMHHAAYNTYVAMKEVVNVTLVFIIYFNFLFVGCGDSTSENATQEQVGKEVPDIAAAEALVADLTPYVSWNSSGTDISFDEINAMKEGLSEDRIALGVQLANASTNAIQHIADSNAIGQESTTHIQTIGVDITFSWITPLTQAAFLAFFVALGDTCPNPHFQPPITSYLTRATAISRLTAAGYRYTLNPTGLCAARGPTAYGQLGGDYTKPLYYSVYGSASTPCYRYQGVVSTKAPWTFQVQGAPSGSTVGTREPNPEICEYTWPTWWWGAYAAYFHMVHC